MNSSHRVNVIRIEEILPHTNADTLGIIQIGGYQCVVKKDQYKVGDLAIYIQPDSVVPQMPQFSFLWADKEFPNGIVPEKYRRITVRRFRKEWSEGLLMPLSDFGVALTREGFKVACPPGVEPPPNATYQSLYTYVGEGDDVAELLGITHYEEPEPGFALGTQGRTLTFWQKILKFFGYAPKPYGPKNAPPKYDVESLKNYPRVFEPNEEVVVTEKIHGSNARYTFDGKHFWVGSHNKWWKEQSNIWWKAAKKYPWIEAFCREWPNFTLYGEVTPTQTGYPYGFETEVQFFAFDLRRPDGTYVDKKNLYQLKEIQQLVPIVYQGPYGTADMKALAEGNSLVTGAKNIREGIVVSSATERHVRGVGRAQLKLKSLKFLEKENK
jgi:RNA ligase (TIGR02306 family)